MNNRPTPEQLLSQVQEQEKKEGRGKLKIYIGAAPGVGKTHTMLEDAIGKREQGLDVIIGVVETHGRQEIEKLCENFEFLPRKIIDYHGRKISEFDLELALKRHPGLILMDEMAHTNAPGLKHDKRWQDIKELLEHGIDVYTTLNIQHIDSYNDIVARIIRAPVNETVPDTMLEMADTIELVDLPPEDLIKRLQEGKVYFPSQIEMAKDHFFKVGNLVALRELALRITAEHVETQVLLYRQGQAIKRIWPVREKILVCVGHGPNAIKLIRTAKRMASSLHAEWIAVHVNAPMLNLTEEQRIKSITHLRFAEKLGAQTKVLTGIDVAGTILSFAGEQNVTQIMVWKNIRPRWREILFSDLATEIVRNSGEIDVHIVTPSPHHHLAESKHQTFLPAKKKTPWKIYLIATSIMLAATAINFAIFPILPPSNLIMIYLLAVVIIALFGRLELSLLASLSSVLLYKIFFLPPHIIIAGSSFQIYFTLGTMLAVAITISQLTLLNRFQAKSARASEQHTAALHALSNQLVSTHNPNVILQKSARYLGDLFDCAILILLPVEGQLTIKAAYKLEAQLDPKEMGIAQWAFELRKTVGLGTDTLSFSEALYLPLLAPQGPIGILHIRPTQMGAYFSAEQMHLLESCANLIAISLAADKG